MRLQDRDKSKPLVVTQSDLMTFKGCRRMWMYGSYRGLRPKTEPVIGPLALGTRVHLALQGYYTDDRDLVEYYNEIAHDELEKLVESKVMFDVTAWQSETDLGRIMLEGYVEWLEDTGADSEYEVIGAEKKLSHVLTVAGPFEEVQVELRGKVDLQVKNLRNGSRLVVDHKPQPVSEKVLTPQGYVRVGDVQIGDELVGSNFKPITVLDIKPRGVDEVSEVVFDDNTTVRATADHPWVTDNGSLIETKDLRGHRLQAIEPDFAEPRSEDLPIDPYVLGFYLGNGSQGGVSDGEVDTILRVAERLGMSKDDVTVSTRPGGQPLYGLRMPDHVRQALKDLNLDGLRSWEKFVPDMYFWAPAVDRLEILRGLLDSDGYMHGSRSIFLTTTSPMLAEGFAFLARSLGMWSKQGVAHDGYVVTGPGEGYSTRPYQRVYVRSWEINPFGGSRYAQKWDDEDWSPKRGRRFPNKLVREVHQVESEDCRCFVVSADDHLYVTNGLALTHNTTAHFANLTTTADKNEQLLFYMLLERLTNQDADTWLQGAMLNMLRKVKRGVVSRPPYYDRLEVHKTDRDLASFWTRLQGMLQDYVRVVQMLDAGYDHKQAAYPTPVSCRYCVFRHPCTLADDGSRVEDLILTMFNQKDPHERYETEPASIMDPSTIR